MFNVLYGSFKLVLIGEIWGEYDISYVEFGVNNNESLFKGDFNWFGIYDLLLFGIFVGIFDNKGLVWL